MELVAILQTQMEDTFWHILMSNNTDSILNVLTVNMFVTVKFINSTST